MWVVIRNTEVELPPYLAQYLVEASVATPVQESAGTQTSQEQAPATASKPRKSRAKSKPPADPSPSPTTTARKASSQSGKALKSSRPASTPTPTDVLDAHLKYAQEQTNRPTALVTLFDTWCFKGAKLDDIKVIASWVPIDHTPAPPDVLEWCRRDNVLPIAMANYGARMLEAAGIDHRYIPHGVDTHTFRPGATVDGATGRQLLNIPDDAFVVGIVAANKGIAPMRKAWGENLLALGQFMAKHDDVYVYMHTEKRGAQGGVDLVQLASACGIPDKRIVWTDQWAYYAGLPPFVLAGLMSAMDVNLAASRGEGFGVPVIEAAACGVPSIVSNFTAQPELVEGHGYISAVQPYWDALQSSWVRHTAGAFSARAT
jgi:hypothetical protein